MKQLLASLTVCLCVASSTSAQVLINEFMANAPGSDSSVTLGNEYFELRGTPGLSLTGYYLLSIEGQGTTGRGDINQFFDLGGFSIGASGFLAGLQFGSLYSPISAGATVLSNSVSQGWGQANGVSGSSVGHNSDGSQLDLENSATTILLINIGAGSAPTLTDDLDTDNDGILDLPAGWTVIDSVGILDGVGAAATDFSYGAVTLRAGVLGTNVNGNVIDVPAGTGTGFYVGRKGNSTGSTADDWFGAFVNGTMADPLNFTFTSASDSFYNGLTLPDMIFGGPNAIPEPTTLGLLGLGFAAHWFVRRRR